MKLSGITQINSDLCIISGGVFIIKA